MRTCHRMVLGVVFLSVLSVSGWAGTESADGTHRVIVFHQAGCGDCAQVDAWLEELTTVMPELRLEKHDIKDIPSMRLNEALAVQFGIPEQKRLLAPAVYTQAGGLVRGDITFGTLAGLLDATLATEPADWVPDAQAEAVEADTDEAITARFERMTVGIVIAAGLLDGINPCAFATILFFLSYLHIARRSPLQILQVGFAFAFAIFLTYLALGLGFAQLLAQAEAVRTVAVAFNWLLAAVALILALLCIRDGILCLQGKLDETALKLPLFLRKRINATIRQGARHSRFVTAAFIAGVVVALLELACTGQVYAPTILYMLKTGASQATAFGYLVLYNLAFVVPLLIVILLAFQGLSNERLTAFFQKHVALVKFATAGLFLVMLALLLRDLLT